MEAADVGYATLKKMGIPYNRPNDYFAEMVKTDDHMDRVRKKLLAEKAKVEGIEERRRVREMKKYGKEIQRQKEKYVFFFFFSLSFFFFFCLCDSPPPQQKNF